MTAGPLRPHVHAHVQAHPHGAGHVDAHGHGPAASHPPQPPAWSLLRLSLATRLAAALGAAAVLATLVALAMR